MPRVFTGIALKKSVAEETFMPGGLIAREVNRRLDIFGILVLSFVAGNFGGISRDLLIGAVPPAALTNW
jgi:uncharacterized membrane protein YeiH